MSKFHSGASTPLCNSLPDLCSCKKIFRIPVDGMITEIFDITPRMSTYLVAVVISDFKSISTEDDNHLYRIWARGDAVTQGAYGLSVSPSIIQFMENFTNIPFEFKKLDQAAIPDLSPGAMENWALVTYRLVLVITSYC
jgi:aminopeptidase N